MKCVRTVILSFALAGFAGCGGPQATMPTPLPPPPAAAAPRPPRDSMVFDVTGVVADEAGAPIAGAVVEAWYDYNVLATGTTDASGTYNMTFTGRPGMNYVAGHDPAGIEDAVAFLQVDTTRASRATSAFEPYDRYLLGTGGHLVENIRLRRITRVGDHDSVNLTVDRNDSVCVVDAWPGRELVCGTVRIMPTASGVLHVTAQGAARSPLISAFGSTSGARGNPAILQVTAGIEYRIEVEQPWGFSSPETFTVSTDLTVKTTD